MNARIACNHDVLTFILLFWTLNLLLPSDPSGLSIAGISPFAGVWEVEEWFEKMSFMAQEAAAGGAASPLQAFFSSPLPLFAGLAMIWYMTWFLPEKRKRQDEANMLATLVKNDRIVTLGGLHGTIVSAAADSDVIVLKIDEAGSTRVKVNRSAIVAITEHAKGKNVAKSGAAGKIPDGDTKSKNASDEDSSE